MKVRTARKIITNSFHVYFPDLIFQDQLDAEYRVSTKDGKILLSIKYNKRLHYKDHQQRRALNLMKKVLKKRL